MESARTASQPTPPPASSATPPVDPRAERLPAEFVYHVTSGPAMVSVRQHGRPDRIRRAALAWAGCWGAAILAVPLMVIHWVLVPALIVGGPLYAMVMLRERVTVLGADGDCPACGVAQHPRMKAGASDRM